MIGNTASGYTCPECGCDIAYVHEFIEDNDGYLVGTVLVCKRCEHHWEQRHHEQQSN